MERKWSERKDSHIWIYHIQDCLWPDSEGQMLSEGSVNGDHSALGQTDSDA
jgi:hypothetical protein